MKIYGVIYKTTCLVNGKIYIGQTVHWRDKSYLGSGVAFVEAVKKYGKNKFKRKILKICYNQKQLDAWEMIMIRKYNSTDKNIGYNVLVGTANKFGSGNPTHMKEVVEKIREKKKGKWGGDKCYWYGKHLSEETRKKLSDRAKRRLSDPTKNGMYGKKHSEETKKKMAQKALGRQGYNKGKHLSEETRRRISVSVSKFYKEKKNNGEKQICDRGSC